MMIFGMIGGRPVPVSGVLHARAHAPSVRGSELAAEVRAASGRAAGSLAKTITSPAGRVPAQGFPDRDRDHRTECGGPAAASGYLPGGWDPAERLELLGQTAGQRGWWDAYADTLNSDYAALIGLEDQATSIRWYAAQIVPGLAQTEAYARVIVRSGSWTYPPGEIERRVQVRMNRQKILTRDQPVTLAVVLDEAVLHHQVGGPQLMRAQLRHLAELSSLPNVEVQVLPDTAGAHAAVHGDFQILGFPELIATDVVYLEHLTSSIYVEREAEVFRYSLAFDQLRALALSDDDSRARIEAQAATLS